MDEECAFCGRNGAATHQMFCQDCLTHHRVCGACAADTALEAATLGLEVLEAVESRLIYSGAPTRLAPT